MENIISAIPVSCLEQTKSYLRGTGPSYAGKHLMLESVFNKVASLMARDSNAGVLL